MHSRISALAPTGNRSRRRRAARPALIAAYYAGPTPLLAWLAVPVIVLAFVLGGGTRQGLWLDALVQLASLPLLALAVRQLWSNPPAARWPLALAAAAVLLPALQLLPLPPAVWSHLPGRDSAVAAFALAGIPLPWEPVSLDPLATWRGILFLLVPVSVFLATLSFDGRTRRNLTLLILALSLASVLLALAQLVQGPDSPLRFHEITNLGDGVGFFANRNHQAALTYALLPFAAAWATGLMLDRRPERMVGLGLCLLVCLILTLGLAMTRSRAGIMLGMLTAVAGAALAFTSTRGHERKRALIGVSAALVAGTVLVAQLGLLNVVDRFDEAGLVDLSRIQLNATTGLAASSYAPIGSGFGTFVWAYQLFERPETLAPVYANHAHNDWMEIWLEGGWPAAAALAAFLAWFAAASVTAWRSSGEKSALDRAILRAATMTIPLLLIHSAVDYPLRTTALATVFAFACALLVQPVQPRRAAAQRGPGPADRRPERIECREHGE